MRVCKRYSLWLVLSVATWLPPTAFAAKGSKAAKSSKAGKGSKAAKKEAAETEAEKGASPTAFSSAQIKKLGRGIFEIVTPKVEDTAITYKEKLPTELLPFKDRNDPYQSIGTAFAIGPKKLASAAHVFRVHLKSMSNKYLVRDSEGNVYAVARFTKYSQYRDIVEFELAEYPKTLLPLPVAAKNEIGDVVYAAGNAFGDGIVTRSGNITSYTPESLEGAWKHIRFSAAASPGNSGGPLLDAKGAVVGIVVMKSSGENLNYAVPMAELDKLASDKSEFYLKGLAEGEAGKTLRSDWKFSSPLPASYDDLAKATQQSFYASFQERRKQFEQQYKNDLFPNDQALARFLRAQPVQYLLAPIDKNGDGQWVMNVPEYGSIKMTANRTLYLSDGERYRHVIVERPDDMSLKDFFDQPKVLLDGIVTSVKWSRPFADRRIEITSYGKPVETNRWVDELGRPWISSIWHAAFEDSSIQTHCLTYPRGLACLFYYNSVAEEPLRIDEVHENAKRITLSYDGRVKDWIEYLALPDAYRPALFKSRTMKLEGNTLAYSFAPLSGKVQSGLLSPESLFLVGTEYNPLTPLKQDITQVTVKPRSDKNEAYQMATVLEPPTDSSDSQKTQWKGLVSREAPFNGKPVNRGDRNELYRIVQRKPPKENKAPYESLMVFYCAVGSEGSTKDLEKSCTAFTKSAQ